MRPAQPNIPPGHAGVIGVNNNATPPPRTGADMLLSRLYRLPRLTQFHPQLRLPIQLAASLLAATSLTACTEKPATLSTAERTKAVAEKQKTTQEKMPDQATLARAVESLASTQDNPPPSPAKN